MEQNQRRCVERRGGHAIGREPARRIVHALPLLLAASLVACASAAPSPAPRSSSAAANMTGSTGPSGSTGMARSSAEPAPETSRVMVKLRTPSVDRAAVAAQAQEVAGVPVRAAGAVSPEWQALSLDCATEAACEAAIDRLRADTGRYVLVEIDRRQGTMPPPNDRSLAK